MQDYIIKNVYKKRKEKIMKINILFEYLRLLKKRLFLYLVSIFFMTVFGAFFDVAGSMLTKQVFAVAPKKIHN